ncbi:SDR family oxidoreductase [Frigidibacter albus]|uniref:SDR family oxidoreductase n=1 Tax=Frigidibacter albus TaxID=1465486 RepID=A0A6L8VG12_9RHOB|nr:SDR family oxidoreductase [Frigidibacter albus]MZQ88596.1 SDR family oxidoreductase [Frigidibacter albus]NBE30595.1 SDR family oxidoreductase [Frigidibacter albus]GGH49364.1 short-chain dehydrogenase/reductase [Frigidibacter albus]
MPEQITAIVTGHSRGLGAAIAAELLTRGAKVLGLARKGNPALAAAHPGRLTEVALDLADPVALAEWLPGLGAHLGGAGPVLLVNNAGMVEPIGPAGTLDPSAIARAVALNVTAPLMLADALIAVTEGADDRRILHVSSGAARNAYAGWSLYCATKAALDHHGRAVAEDKRPGLRIESLAPGVIDTDMQAAIRATTEAQFTLRERFVGLKESGGLASPEDCARRLVAHLIGPAFGASPVTDLRDI